MSGTEFVLACALLVMPAGTPFPAVPADEWPVFQRAVHELAIEWEILDPREVKYILAKPEDLSTDLDLLRRRYADLKDAPRLNDSRRFPDRSVVNEMLAFNRAFRKHLDTRQAVDADRSVALREAAGETEHLYQVWDAVRDARCDFYYVTVRRHALKKLRNLVGPAAYYAGDLPPYVPVWRFQEMY